MGRLTKFALFLLAVVALAVHAKLHFRGKPQEVLPASDCDASLWNHTYEKERLHIIADCTAVEGRVVGVRQAEDGDLHISLNPDRKSVLNLVNVIHAHRTLVVELVCEHPPKEDPARAACGDFHPAITVPRMDDRVRIIGAYVTDTDNGWNEIHPVSRIEVLH